MYTHTFKSNKELKKKSCSPRLLYFLKYFLIKKGTAYKKELEWNLLIIYYHVSLREHKKNVKKTSWSYKWLKSCCMLYMYSVPISLLTFFHFKTAFHPFLTSFLCEKKKRKV